MQTQDIATARTAPATQTAPATPYDVDTAHASAQFKVRHLMVSWVRGELGPVTGRVQLDERDLSRSSVTASIDASKIDTRNADRDAHLRSADFLDVERFPSITFQSTRVVAVDAGNLTVTGDLTIRGVSRSVDLAVELSGEIRDPWGNVKRGATATARIDRKDFGLTWNATMDAGGLVVGDQVSITIELELTRGA